MIRPATPDETPRIVEMGQSLLRSAPGYADYLGERSVAAMTSTVDGLIAQPTGLALVADDGDRLVGMIGFILFPHFVSGQLTAGEVFWWVEPDKRGIGVRLLRAAERWAAEHGAERLQMIAPSQEVERLYERLGYTPVERTYQRAIVPIVESIVARMDACDAQVAQGVVATVGMGTDVPDEVFVYDNVLPDPDAYRAYALSLPFRSVSAGAATFHGLADCADPALPTLLRESFPVTPTLSFFRKSPEGQIEPSFIHTDRDMGDWTAILYLHPHPPEGDGTAFWRWRVTGATHSIAATEAELKAEWIAWRDRDQWEPWQLVPAAYNRLIVFPAPLFHSRAIPENYGQGDDARLIQLVFGTGTLREAVCASAPQQRSA